jgi:hypothetical protein
MSKKDQGSPINFSGKVVCVHPKKTDKNGKWSPTTFTVSLVKDGRRRGEVTCLCNDFCDPIEHDVIVGTGIEQVVKGHRQITLTRQPFLIPSSEREGIINIIIKTMKKVYYQKPKHTQHPTRLNVIPERARILFDSIKRRHKFKRDIEVVEYLDRQAEVVKTIEEVGRDGEIFASKWYETSVIRRLNAIGVTRMDLRNYRESKIDLYRDILDNPYKVVFLSIDKCNSITIFRGDKLDMMMASAGTVLRYIYKRYTQGGHFFVKGSELQEQFGYDYKKCRRLLYERFDVVFEDASSIEQSHEGSDNSNDYTFKSVLCRTKLGLPTVEEYRPFDIKADPEHLNVYMNSVYQVELAIAEYAIMMSTLPPLPTPELTFTRIDLSQDQIEGITYAATHRLCILTGGAGTGKTTAINELYCNNEHMGRETAVVTLTGRAASVLRNKIKGCPASTVHRYLAKDHAPVHLIIDEASMLPSRLFYQLLTRYPTIEQVTLVGDDGQITPVEPGAFFHNYVDSGTIPTYRLTENHRVKSGKNNGIVKNAKRIAKCRRGRRIKLEEGDNFYIQEGNDVTPLIDRFIGYNRTIERNRAKGKEVTNQPITTRMFTIICPLREQVHSINKLVQSRFRSGEYMHIGKYGMTVYLEDRVMMLANDYNVDVFNGEEGFVVELNPDEGYIIVDFTQPSAEVDDNGRVIRKLIKVIDDVDMEPWVPSDDTIGDGYKSTIPGTQYRAQIEVYNEAPKSKGDTIRASAITLSYAITPHKYQGSESPYIIIVLPDRERPSSFLSRNLLYTACTRAERSLTIVGSRNLINMMASNDPSFGNDNTCNRLCRVLKPTSEKKLDNEESESSSEEFIEEEYYDYDYDDDDQYYDFD